MGNFLEVFLGNFYSFHFHYILQSFVGRGFVGCEAMSGMEFAIVVLSKCGVEEVFVIKSIFRVLVLCVLFFSFVELSFAIAVIQESPAGNAYGITGLDVSGYGTFDVTFGHTFTAVWGDPSAPNPVPTFWGDPSGATVARDAINAVFNLDGGISTAGGRSRYCRFLLCPF